MGLYLYLGLVYWCLIVVACHGFRFFGLRATMGSDKILRCYCDY